MTGIAAALAKEGFTNAPKQEVKGHLSTGNPVLDQRLSGKYVGGGIPQGRVGEIAGPSSAGKTAIASNVLANTQKQGGVGIFMDHEKSFDASFAKASFGLSDDPDQWIYDMPMTYEESWDRVKGILYVIRGVQVNKEGKITLGTPLLPFDKPCSVIFDSLASMTPQQKFIKASEDQGMNDHLALAKLTSQTFDVMASIAELTNTAFVFLNQIRTKPGVMYGDPTTTPGGNAPEYYCSWRLRLGKSMLKDGKEKIGQRIGCETVKNKTYRPFQKCEWDFMFGQDGYGRWDVIGAVIDELKDLGIIPTAGAYLVWDGKKIYRDKLIEQIEESGEYPRLLSMLPTGS
jgi:recombination protein RecA